MKTYRSRPTTVQAVQWDGKVETAEEINIAAERTIVDIIIHTQRGVETFVNLWVEANQKWLPIEVGEWILKDRIGYYPCKDEIFREKYEEV